MNESDTNIISSSTQMLPSIQDSIISDVDIMREWGVSLSFVNQHSNQMKPFRWRPRKYFRIFVERFFVARATAGQKKTKYTRTLALRDFEDAKVRIRHKQSKHNGHRRSGERGNIEQRAKHE